MVVSGLLVYIALRLIDFAFEAKEDTAGWIGLGGLILIGIYAISAKVGEWITRRGKPSGQAVVDAAFGDQFSVEIHLVIRGKRLGSDRGVVWFHDGLMGFSGRAFSFVLSAQDIAPQWERVRKLAIKQRYPIDAVVLVGAPKEAYLFVTPLAGQTIAYRQRLYEFKKANAEPTGERHWPPLEPYVQEEPVTEPVVRR